MVAHHRLRPSSKSGIPYPNLIKAIWIERQHVILDDLFHSLDLAFPDVVFVVVQHALQELPCLHAHGVERPNIVTRLASPEFQQQEPRK